MDSLPAPDDTTPHTSNMDSPIDLDDNSALSSNIQSTQSSSDKSSRLGNVADTIKTNYTKTSGFSGLRGEAFEFKMCALLHSRATNLGYKFLMASSMKGLGAFDDIVLKVQHGTECVNYFLQLKNKVKAKINESSFLQGKDFGLQQYLKSYLEVRKYFKSKKNSPIFNGKLENCIFILYTNADVDENLKPKESAENADTNNIGAQRGNTDEFLMTGGNVLILNEEDHKNIYDGMENPEEYREFLANFKIMYKQANEKELDTLIMEEVKKIKELNTQEIELASKTYRDFVQDWWKDSNFFLDESLKPQNPLKKTLDYMNLTMANRILRNRKNEIEKLRLEFTESVLQDMAKTTISNNCILIFAPGRSTILTAAKLHQSLAETPEHMIIKLQHLVEYKTEVLNTWKDKTSILIIEVHPSKENYFDIFSEISKIQRNDSKGMKVIFIIQSTHSITQMDSLRAAFGSELYEISDSIKMADFTITTQESFLKKRVMFQGREIKLSKLVNVDGITMLERLDSDSLSSLLADEKPRIGANLQESIHYYIDRTLETERFYVDSHILLDVESIFALCGSSISEIRNVLPLGEKIYNLREWDKSSSRRFVFVDNVEDYNYLCMQSDNVHWLGKVGDKLVWMQTKGNRNIVNKYIIQNDMIEWRPNTTLESEERIVMITADPGMGKSTLLTHLAKQTSEKHPDTWIIRININGYSKILLKIKQDGFQENEVMDLLLDAAGISTSNSTLLEKNLFHHCCEHTGNMAVLVDGVDEVNPFYSEEVFMFLRHLKKTKIKKLWIAARASIKRDLEDEFGISSSSLVPFNENDQKSFLMKYWRSVFEINESDLGNLADDVLNLISKNFIHQEKSFLGIPLQTLLVAEIMKSKIKFEDNNVVIVEKEYLNILNLYDLYTERKWSIYLEDKKNSDLSNVNVLHENKKLYYKFIQNHELSGMISILSTEELAELNLSNLPKKATAFLKKIEEGNEKTGIITDFKEGRPEFIHRTFAEYFAAKWFEKNIISSKKFLQKVIFTRRFEVIKIILDRLLSVNNVLHTAVINDDLTFVREHYERDEKDKGGRTPLHLGVIYSNVQMITFLLTHGENVHFRDKMLGLSPLQYAIKSSKWSALAVIMEKRPETRQCLTNIDRDKYDCIKQVILECCKNGYVNLLIYLLDKEIDTDSVFTQYNISLLHEAVRNGHVAVVKSLTELGINVNVRDSKRRTPLHISSEKGQFEIVQFLVDKHTEEFKTKIQTTQCSEALDETVTNSIYLYLDLKDEEGNTALHLACKFGRLDIVNYLIDRGSSTECRNNQKQNSLVVAAKARHYKVACLLLTKECHEIQEALFSICEIECHESTNLMFCVSNKVDFQKLINTENVKFLENLLEFGANFDSRISNGNTALHAACAAGNLDIVAYILNKHPNMLNIQNKKQETPLYVAAANGRNWVIEYLINMEPIDIESKNIFQNTPLHVACIYGHQDTVQLLLTKGISVTIKNRAGETPVFLATRNGNYGIVKSLLTRGVDSSKRSNDGSTILLVACQANHFEIAKLIFKYTNCFEVTDNKGDTCLHFAAGNGNFSLVEFICEQIRNLNVMNKAGETSLFKAAEKGHCNIIRILINKGADLNIITNKGTTALVIAIKNYHMEAIKLLYRANGHCGTNSSPLFSAVTYGNLGIIPHLIKNGENVNDKNTKNQTILHWACINGHFFTVKLLVEHNADINAQDYSKRTPLHYATENGNINTVKELVKAGASTENRDRKGCTPLHIAANRGNLILVTFLVENGSPIDARNMRCETPLFIAALNGKEEIAQYFIKMGAGILVKDINGNTLYDQLSDDNNYNILSILRDRAKGKINVLSTATTELHESAQLGDHQLTLELLTAGHPVDVSDSYGRTPLWHASFYGHSSVVKLLCDYGSGIKNDFMGLKPIHVALMNKHISVVEVLLQENKEIFGDYKILDEAQTDDSFEPIILNGAKVELYTETINMINVCSVLTRIIQELLYKCSQEGLINTLTHILKYYDGCLECSDVYGWTPLHIAVYNGHSEMLKIMIKRYAPVNVKNNNGETSLHLAAKKGFTKITQFLLENGAMTNIKDFEGRTPLHVAVHEGYLAIVKLLFNFKATLEISDEEGKTPFIIAVCENKFHVAQFLLTKSAKIDSCQYIYTPLLIAIGNSNLEIATLIINSGANPDLKSENGLSPLFAATYMGNTHIVQMLIKAGANINSESKDGWTPLHAALYKKHYDIMKILLSKDADVNLKSKNGTTALQISVLHNAKSIIEYLLKNDANIDDADEDGFTCLHLSAQYGYVEVAGILLDNNCKATKINKDGFTPLHIAVLYGQMEVVVALLERGCSANICGERNVTPLHLSVNHNHLQITEILLNHGANINKQNEAGLTALHTSVNYNRMEMVRLLINRGADVNIRSEEGMTALHCAVQTGNLDMVKLLIENSANITVTTRSGLYPLQVAAKEGNMLIVEYLQQFYT